MASPHLHIIGTRVLWAVEVENPVHMGCVEIYVDGKNNLQVFKYRILVIILSLIILAHPA